MTRVAKALAVKFWTIVNDENRGRYHVLYRSRRDAMVATYNLPGFRVVRVIVKETP